MTSSRIIWTSLLFATIAACGNYSNEDLEFMNAVPARQDLVASIKSGPLVTANEAELAKDTHNVVAAFNGALDFLKVADLIRTYQPTSRIPDGRIWGPFPDNNHPGWQWRFVMTKDAVTADKFNYSFDEQQIGGGDTWYTLLDGWFIATGGGVRRGMGDFTLQTDAARMAGFQFELGDDGKSELKSLHIAYSTADYPISVVMNLVLYPNAVTGDFTNTGSLDCTYEALQSGQGGLHFDATDSASGKSLSVDSRWLPTGRGRADATYTDPTNGVSLTWNECWDDSFMSVYDNKPWATPPAPVTTGDATLCPDIPTL
ncbi:MAG TPA: hypothetical protein VKQ32_07560 [Polyangia bacterium]|nr:hypothetical protein [Polyangia bacterium]